MGRLRRLLLVALLGTASLVAPLLQLAARAQMDYETQYGPIADVSVDDLLQMPESYSNRGVRTRGRLEMIPTGGGGPVYALRGTFGGRLYVKAMNQIALEWEDHARTWVGAEVEVTGVVGVAFDSDSGAQSVVIGIWTFVGPPDERKAPPGKSTETTLEELVTKPGKLDGRLVTVRGQFRGENLFGDLPSASRRHSKDWVIKDELFAAWITGKKPKGPGWTFDPGLRRDTGKWLQVTGRVSTVRGVVSIEATSIVLSKPPSPTAEAQPAPLPTPAPKKPPVVVFSLPLDGERDVAPNTVFKVQFSKDMEPASFKDRVLLRYAGRPQPGDRDLDAVKMEYAEPRTLAIDPGDLLRAGRVVEILFLPGIQDMEGLALQTRPGTKAGTDVTDVLRFQITPNAIGAAPLR